VELTEGASVQLLGGLSVHIGGKDVTAGIGGRVGQLAFAYLMLHRDRPVRRDELAAAIWEENAPADPDAALRVVLTRLRKALGPDAVQGRAELSLRLPEPLEVDIEDLDRAALGELLPGLESDWITDRRAALADQRVGTLAELGRAALEAGDLPGAERAARQLIAVAPFREGGHRLLIQTLAARGEVAEALRTYEQFRVLLREELGMTPSRELAALHTELLRSDADTARPTGATYEQLALPAAASVTGGPTLAGRAAELASLEAARAAAAAGGPVHVLVGGEPGIGKSRLAAELGRRAHTGGWNVIWGRCHEEALVPYEPFVEALRQYAGALSNQQLAELAHAAGTEFLAVAPDLARRLPRATLAPAADDAQARRYRLFESIAEVLALAAGARPLVLVLEDVHWGDRGTMLLLGHILRRAASVPLLIVATYRTTEVGAEHPVRSLSEGAAVELGRLSAAETAQIVAELAPDADVGLRIHAETGGNPLFVLEALRSLAQEGELASVPGGIGDVIDRRLRRLSRDGSTVLGVGAVLGRTFTVTEVARVTGLPQARLLDAVEEALAARVIEEVPDTADTLSFTHALLREVRYRQHSAARRTALHQGAAEAIRALYALELDEHLADLATHLEASVRDQSSARAAVEALRQAGEQAAARQAFEDAAGWFERAHALFETARPSETGRCDVLLSLAEALRASDRVDDARAAASEAAGYAREFADGERLARAAFAFVGSHLVFKAGRPDREDIALLEEAVESVPAASVGLRIRLLARLCTAIYYSERFDEVPAIAQRTYELALADGDEDALGWAYYTRFWAALEPGAVEESKLAMSRLAPIAASTNSLELTSETAMVQWYGMLRAGRPDLLAVELESSRERIVRTGIPIYRWFADAMGAVLAVTQGRLDEAEAMIVEVARSGGAIDRHDLPRFATIPMLQLRHHQGRLGELIEPLRVVVANNPGLPLWRAVLLEALAASGATDEARALLGDLAAQDFGWLRRDVNWLWAMAATSSACVMLGEREVAGVVYRLLSEVPAQSVVCGPALGFFGPVQRYIAPLAAMIGRPQEADERFRGAIAELERAGARPLAAATRAQLDALEIGAETSA
jgi:DNA-binding SARP family transcriptional activator